jgi:release factor glutamine methyltransferase
VPDRCVPPTSAPTGPTIAEALQQASARLAAHDSARLDAEVLLMHVLNKPRSHLHAWPEQVLRGTALARFETLVTRRAAGEPVAHLTGRREFWSLALEVTADTLIPRPDTETLVEQALALLPANQPLCVADLGTGSGAIAIALAHERHHWRLYALDRSPACVSVARRNAARLGVPGLRFLIGDWSNAFSSASLDAIVANPPYVDVDDPHLQQGDVRFEPPTALAAGADGLDDIRRLTADAPRVLRPGGYLLLEHAPAQSRAIQDLLLQRNFKDIRTVCDLAGRERVTSARRGP